MKTRKIVILSLIISILVGFTGCTSNEKNEIEKENTFVISYESETYTTDNGNGEIVFRNERNLPVITNGANQKVADQIVESLTEISDENWKYLTETVDEYTEYTPVYENPYGVSYIISTAAITENYITFEIDQDGSMGGVSWTAREFYTYDTTTGDLLKLEDMAIDVDELKTFISHEVREYIEENFTNYIPQADLDDTIDEIISQVGNYGILDDKFIVVLPKYSIGAGADGVRKVEINKDDINSYLIETYKIKP